MVSKAKKSSPPRYRMEVFYSPDDEGFIARLVQFHGISAFGETEEEALKELRVAVDNWLAALRKRGEDPPPPIDERQFSGEFRLRIPQELHRELTVSAERNGVSLNTYCVEKLAQVARPAPAVRTRKAPTAKAKVSKKKSSHRK